jgi:hypothetical protein
MAHKVEEKAFSLKRQHYMPFTEIYSNKKFKLIANSAKPI